MLVLQSGEGGFLKTFSVISTMTPLIRAGLKHFAFVSFRLSQGRATWLSPTSSNFQQGKSAQRGEVIYLR